MRSYTYILEGHPDVLTLKNIHTIGMWNQQREQKLITDITLGNLHENKPILNGQISISVDYHFIIPDPKRTHIRAKKGEYCNEKPSLFALFNFIEHSARGIMFRESAHIVNLVSNKYWTDEKPYTVFTITELREEKQAVPKKGDRKKTTE